MLLDGFILSLIVGLLRKGKLRRFRKFPLRYAEVFAVPFLLQFAIFFGAKRSMPFFQEYGSLLYVGSFAILLFALVLNHRIFEFRIAALGVLLNFLVVGLNGGKMPVREELLGRAMLSSYAVESIRSGENPQFTLLAEETRLKPLADVFVLPRPYPRPSVFSIGDLVLTLAVVVLVQRMMCSSRYD